MGGGNWGLGIEGSGLMLVLALLLVLVFVFMFMLVFALVLGKLYSINGDLVPDSLSTLKKELL